MKAQSDTSRTPATSWQGSTVNVQARLVPRFFWMTASLAVFVGEQRVLQTGGGLTFSGVQSAEFTHAGARHTAELKWGTSGLSFSFPYELRIDGVLVSVSRVFIRNWPVGLLAAFLIATVLLVIFYYFVLRRSQS
jgi:hypothetical protein